MLWPNVISIIEGHKCQLNGKRLEKENGSFKMRQSFDIDCGSAIF